MYANITIPTNIDNAVQTIREIRLTTDGTSSGKTIVLLNGSGATNSLQVSGNIVAGKSFGADANTLAGLYSTIVAGLMNILNGNNSVIL